MKKKGKKKKLWLGPNHSQEVSLTSIGLVLMEAFYLQDFVLGLPSRGREKCRKLCLHNHTLPRFTPWFSEAPG